ncbi:MAG: hypothetical protein DI526_14375 [Caulobacter segnis]|uniref:Uncharacterized protein n=2 Tax=Caulobacter segnis TaxID=88688 RepID=A0A2W5V5Q8_9CAUL|nr:MAG: hypothetical protein DI526_14375 [Caulobacter segnis]
MRRNRDPADGSEAAFREPRIDHLDVKIGSSTARAPTRAGCDGAISVLIADDSTEATRILKR